MLKNNLAKHLIHVGATILTLTLTVVMQILPGVKKLLWWYLPSVILTLSLLYPGLLSPCLHLNPETSFPPFSATHNNFIVNNLR